MMRENVEQEHPIVSVVMPAYCAAKYIEQAICSVIGQTFRDWELLVIDDCSADDTYAIACTLSQKDSRIRVMRNEVNMGVSKTRNRALEFCRGDYIALLDSDDIWHPDKLERQLRLLTESHAELAYSSYRIIDGSGTCVRSDYIVPDHVDFEGLLRENVIGCSTVMIKRQRLVECHFEADLYHEDYMLWLRLLRNGCRAVGCVEPLVDWRLIQNSRSYDKRSSAKRRWMVYRDYLKLPIGKSLWFFCAYAVNGMRKYLKVRR